MIHVDNACFIFDIVFMKSGRRRYPALLAPALRVVLSLGLGVQAVAVGFYVLMGVLVIFLDIITWDFSWLGSIPWLGLGALAVVLLAIIHLLARFAAHWPWPWKKRWLDILACLTCMALPAWAHASFAIEGDWTFDSHAFYASFTAFDAVVLVLALVPQSHGYLFGRT